MRIKTLGAKTMYFHKQSNRLLPILQLVTVLYPLLTWSSNLQLSLLFIYFNFCLNSTRNCESCLKTPNDKAKIKLFDHAIKYNLI